MAERFEIVEKALLKMLEEKKYAGLRDILRNSVLMFILHFFQSIGMIVLNLVPWAMMLVLPEIFAQTGIFWVLYGASGIAYFNARVLLKIFKKHEPEPEDAPEEA